MIRHLDLSVPVVESETIEQYIANMQPVVASSYAQSIHQRSTILTYEDLKQEATIVLWQVFEKYKGTVSERELRKIGTRAVFNTAADLYRKENSKGRGGPGEAHGEQRKQRRMNVGCGIVPYPILDLPDRDDTDEEGVTPDTERALQLPAPQLDRLMIREAMDELLASATKVERRTLRAAMRPGSLDTTESRALFRTMRGKVRRCVNKTLAK